MTEPTSQENLETAVSRRELVSGWIKNGLTTDAVAAYGTSVENFIAFMERGEIPAVTEHEGVLSRKDFQEKGRHLYYFHPLGDNLKAKDPSFYKLMIKNVADYGLAHNRYGEQAISNDVMLHDVRIYARNNALMDSVASVTGEIEEVDVIGLAIDQNLGLDDQRVLQKHSGDLLKTADKIRKLLEEKGIDPNTINKRRGVLLFFNRRIFNNSTAFPGLERPDEFVLARQKPLSLESISGIEVYTDKETEELKKYNDV